MAAKSLPDTLDLGFVAGDPSETAADDWFLHPEMVVEELVNGIAL